MEQDQVPSLASFMVTPQEGSGLCLLAHYYGVNLLLQVEDESAMGWSPVGRCRTEAQRQLVAVMLDLAGSLPSLAGCPLQITQLP